MAKTFSIRYKFLLVTTLLLLFCVTAYLFMATTVFRRDKLELVFDYNRSSVSNIASDVEGLFSSVAEKMKLIAYLVGSQNTRKDLLLANLLQRDSQIVFLGTSQRLKKIDQIQFIDKNFTETYGIEADQFKNQLSAPERIPFDKLLSEGEAIWNASLPSGGPLLIGYGRSVVEEDRDGRPLQQFAVISYIKIDKILRGLTRGQLSEVFIVNNSGELLVHPNGMSQFGSQDEVSQRLVAQARASQVKSSVLQFEVETDEILGAFSKAFNERIIVIAQTSSRSAFAAVNRLVYRSVLFGLIVLTLAFIAAILFSRSLTRPIEVLVGGMKKVSGGDLDTQIKVRSKDEIQMLANSFNRMIEDLKDSRHELEEINRDLENKVKERTAQLERQNQAVKSAQEALLKSTRLAAVGEIAGRAAHEVLNPLTNIMTRVQKIKDRISSQGEIQVLSEITESWKSEFQSGGFEKLIDMWGRPSQVDAQKSLWEEDLNNISLIEQNVLQKSKSIVSDVDFLLREGQRINRIVQSMRSLSVIKNDKKLHTANDLISESIHIMADLASQYDVKIEFDSDPKGIKIKVDYDEFIQSLTNVLRNSIQAIAEKKESQTKFIGQIKVSAKASSVDQLEISIVDNGIGVDESHKSKLFETQFTTKPREHGTGLGLNICRRFIRSFNGEIYLKESKVGEGSVFVIELPVAKTEVDNRHEQESA